ncbi:MAG: transglycosylase SLT domain-containing protein [Chloroflexi bacterium]|nr:transglycosylase SLT domain-containing protein [Chloroflexota bacterium]
MSLHRSPPPSTAAVSAGDGCLSGFLLPPLAVLVVGGMMAFFLLRPADVAATAGEALLVETTLEAPFSPVQGNLSPVFTDEVDYWAEAILRWAAAAGLDPNLAATVMQIESCGDPRALSSAGAMGLFQVMPYHFTADENPYAPDTNATRGLDYLRRSLEAAAGNPRLALAGYNGGIGVIGRSESTWATQTVRYAYWGSGIYAEASSGAEESLRLQEWLVTSGLSLCRQAAERLGISP